MRIAIVVAFLTAGCASHPGDSMQELANGSACGSDDDCAMRSCVGGTCNSGKCLSAQDPECASPFSCALYQGGLFGNGGGYLCRLDCSDTACPALYLCDSTTHCVFTDLTITYAPSPVTTGVPITFTGSTPDGTIVTASWQFTGPNVEPDGMGVTTTQTFSTAGMVTAAFYATKQDGLERETQVSLTVH